MKKILLSAAVIGVFVLYIFYQRGANTATYQATNNPTPTQPAVADNPVQNQNSGQATGTPQKTTPPPPPIKNPPVVAGKYKNGTYTGTVADAYYGPLQVVAVIQNGKIVDVQFLQYPHDRNTSVEINTQAMPYLKTEAIQAQSANVDIVSGATQTSMAFRETMQSALSQAI